MEHVGNDRWRAHFTVAELGEYEYTIEAWVDRFETWRHELSKKFGAGQEVSSELLEGAAIVRRIVETDGGLLEEAAASLEDATEPVETRVARALSEPLRSAMVRRPDRSLATRYDRVVEGHGRTGARPLRRLVRDVSAVGGTRSVAQRDVRRGGQRSCPTSPAMGFDVLYLPPIHPIGRSFRKGRNNCARGGSERSRQPLGDRIGRGGTRRRSSRASARSTTSIASSKPRDRHGLEIALDLAYQASPDHPYVREHPEWFRQRPDGTIKYAENPPKKYQDIYPINFESDGVARRSGSS